jgi:hypothetical protein
MDNCSLGMISPDGKTGTDGCCGLPNPNDQLLCEALYDCIAAHSGPPDNCTSYGDPTVCFCGTAGTAGGGLCFSVKGAANGPCVSQVIAAAKTDDLTQIQARFISANFPAGRAVNLAVCRGSFCSTECGIQ